MCVPTTQLNSLCSAASHGRNKITDNMFMETECRLTWSGRGLLWALLLWHPANQATGGNRMPRSSNDAACVVVSAASVALVSPAVPVKEGQDVPLHCEAESSASNFQATFFKNGSVIGNGRASNVTIRNFSASDQGPYWCKINGGESPHSWLLIEGKYPDPTSVSWTFCLTFVSDNLLVHLI